MSFFLKWVAATAAYMRLDFGMVGADSRKLDCAQAAGEQERARRQDSEYEWEKEVQGIALGCLVYLTQGADILWVRQQLAHVGVVPALWADLVHHHL